MKLHLDVEIIIAINIIQQYWTYGEISISIIIATNYLMIDLL